MSDIAVSFEHVAKRYKRGHAPSFREDTVHAAARLVGRAGPRPTVQALDDVSFQVDKGSSFALMGANGSGKTTALKLISRVTRPSAGVVRVSGRVGGLIEVGTGLHPDLTGRENIWLYGQILGLRRADIARRFGSIVDFSDIGEALDQPVKQYSSGMQLRLGFALASHLEPDVLLVDEVVSVGDAGFQQRCLERMSQIYESGATLIFVSHVPAMVTSLCSNGLVLDRGRVVSQGDLQRIVSYYLNHVVESESDSRTDSGAIVVRSWDFSFTPGNGRFLGDLELRVDLDVSTPSSQARYELAIGHQRRGALIGCHLNNEVYPVGSIVGPVQLVCRLSDLPLEPGEYEVWMDVRDESSGDLLLSPRRLGFAAFGYTEAQRRRLDRLGRRDAPLLDAPQRWEVKKGRRT